MAQMEESLLDLAATLETALHSQQALEVPTRRIRHSRRVLGLMVATARSQLLVQEAIIRQRRLASAQAVHLAVQRARRSEVQEGPVEVEALGLRERIRLAYLHRLVQATLPHPLG